MRLVVGLVVALCGWLLCLIVMSGRCEWLTALASDDHPPSLFSIRLAWSLCQVVMSGGLMWLVVGLVVIMPGCYEWLL